MNSLADNTTVDGLVTLREALGASNCDCPVGDALAGSGGDEIRFHPSMAGGTIRMERSSVPLLVAADVRIVGLGKDQLTIDGDVNADGNGDTRHFDVNAGVTLVMSGLTLTNGYASEGTSGGSIHADGTLVLSNCVLSNNRAGVDGGAIYASSSSPSVTLTDCLVTQSVAYNRGGGVIQLGGSLLIDHSELVGNTATTGDGGGIYSSGPLQIINGSLVKGNSAAGYGGGFRANAALTVSNSAVEANTAKNGGGGYARNASPAVLTDAVFTKNQASLDGGAWYSEVYRPVQMTRSTFTENQATRHGGAAYGLDAADIRDSLFERNMAGGSGGAIYSGGTLLISETTFDANQATLDGGALQTWGSNTLDTCTFTGNTARHGGAVNHWELPLVVGHSLFEGNTVTGDGGAVRNSGPGTYLNSTFRLNQSGNNGGAIVAYEDDYVALIQGGLIEQNSAGTDGSGNGGGIWTNQRRLEVVGTTVRNNTTDDDGGGICVSEGLLTLTDSLVSGNTATNGRAGGIWVGTTAELAVANSTISGNSANNAGGGIYFNGNANTVALVNATLTGNRADRAGTTGQTGGGIFTTTTNVLLQNTVVAGNYSGAGTTASDIQGTVDPASAHSLVGDAATAGGLVHGVNSNLIGVNPQLGPLQDNGGQSQTHALLPGSPAIDAADNALALAPDGEPLWYDQRGYGFDRLVGLYVDMGAYEYPRTGGQLHGRKWFDLDQDGHPDEAWGLSIVTNGGFEEGSLGTGSSTVLNAGSTALRGWYVLRPVDSVRSLWTPAEGARSVDLNALDSGSIAQSLITEPGRRYRVQFALAGNPQGGSKFKTVRVSAAGESEEFTFDTTGRSTPNMGWESKTWEFTAQGSLTTIVFESLTGGNGYGPAIDNVVVQPYGRDDVRIHLDRDGDRAFDPGEPLTFLRRDDPNTAAVDETGSYRFTGLPNGTYSVREVLAEGFEQVVPAAPGSYTVPVSSGQIIRNLDFGNRRDGQISGTKFIDLNNNGIRDRNPLPASSPTVLMVIDVSDTTNRNAGFSVSDMNGDGKANWVLDAELYAMLTLRQELVDLGWGNTAQVGIVVFGSQAVQLDMDPATAGVQLLTTPLADANADGVSDVRQVLRSIRRNHAGTTPGNTDFEAALSASLATLSAQGPAGQTVLFFVSDGLSNSPWSFADEVAQLDALGVHRVAWGFGDICDVADLRRIDPFAERLTSTAKIVEKVTARSRSGAGDGRWLEDGLAGVTIYLDEIGNDQLDAGETFAVTRADDPATADVDETGWYAFADLPIGTYTVREVVPSGYVQTAPLNPDEYTVDLRTKPIADGLDFGNRPAPGCLGGIKGLDADFDGVYESGEPGQSGVTIYLDLNENGKYDAGEPTSVTDANGRFVFHNLIADRYVVRELTPAGFEQIVPAAGGAIIVDLGPEQTRLDLLFVNWDLRGCIEGFKWKDLDGDGERDDDEPGMSGVRIYLDENRNGRWKKGEPYAWTQADDPATPDVDETGWWRICHVVPGTYVVREVAPAGYQAGFPGAGGHTVTVGPRETVGGWLFGNVPQLPGLEGWKFDDWNGNGRRDPNRLCGAQPLLVLTVDLSDSTEQNLFAGDSPGDINNDGFADTVLDGELAALIAVNQALIDRGLDATTSVAIVAFGETAFAADMDPLTPGTQLVTSASADADSDGMWDVEQVLRSLQREDRTNYQAALQTVADTIDAVNPPPGSANMLFVSDGEPNDLEYTDEVENLRDMQVNLSAFGAGRNATRYTLRMIDPDADVFTNPAELVAKFFGDVTLSGGGSGTAPGGSADGVWLEPGMGGVTVYLDTNNNGALDWTDADGDGQWDEGEGERWTLTEFDDPATPEFDETGRYRFDDLPPGTYIVREIVPDGWRWVPPRLLLDDSSLVTQIPFEGNAVDAISGVAAVIHGAALDADRFGLPDSTYSFDGTQWMTFDLAALPVGDESRTLTLWVRSSDGQRDGNAEHLVNWGSAASDQAFGLMMFQHNRWYGYFHTHDVSSGVAADQGWHHLAITLQEGETVVYVDGKREAAASFAPQTAAGLLVIGVRPDLSLDNTFDGSLDDIRIHDRALAGSEVAALYAWESIGRVIDEGYVVHVDYGDSLTDLNFGNRAVLTVTLADDAVFEAAGPAATTGTVSRGGSTDTELTVQLSSSDTGEATVPATVTIPAGQSSATFDLAAWDDFIADGTQTVTITAAAAGFEDATATLQVMDSGAPGVWIARIGGLATTESGGTDTFTVALTSPPRFDVTIGLSSSDDTEGTVSPTQLTFTPADWNLPQMVTITGQDDAVDDGHCTYHIITAVAESEDANYQGINPADVWVTNLNDDTAGVTILADGGAAEVTEDGASDTYSVVLTSQPTADVVIAVMPDGQLSVLPLSLTFTAADWDTPQWVTVTAVDDTLVESVHSGHITHEATSDDVKYQGIDIGSVTAEIIDNDVAGFAVIPIGGLITSEAGSTATFTVTLTGQPAADVTIGLSSNDPGEGTVSPGSLTFTEANWNTPQTVTVTGVDDPVVDGDVAYTVVTAATASSDTHYAGLDPADVSLTNIDNDVAGVTIVLNGGAAQVTEGGAAATYTVVLNTQPASDVLIEISPDTQLDVSPASLTFTATNWNSPQEVTVTAVDDALVEEPHSGQITHAAASGDANYDGIEMASVTAQIVDNDVAGCTVSPTSGLFTSEAGGTATFTIRLTSQPTASVTIGLVSSDPTEGTATPATLTFMPSDWDLAQTVTVTGVDDLRADGDVDYVVVIAAAVSPDLNFNGVDPADVSVTNRDDDTAGVAIVRGGGQTLVREGLFSDTYSINLTSQPTAEVVIAIMPDSQLSVSPGNLTFTAANWDVPQVVTVAAVDDWVAEGTHSGQIAHAASGGDATYRETALPSLTAQIIDNDMAGFAVSPAGGLVTSEAGDQAAFTVRLTSQPTAEVTIDLSSSDLSEGSVLPASLTFTAANWDVPQAVTVTGHDDDLHDGDQVYAIVAAPAASADAGYNNLDLAAVPVTNVDDDLGWQNPDNPYNVDNDNAVTAADVLKIINYINAHLGNPSLPPPPAAPPPFYDVNGDGLCTAADVLAVINYINTYGVGSSAEGEDAPPDALPQPAGSSLTASSATARMAANTQPVPKRGVGDRPMPVSRAGLPQQATTRRGRKADAVFADWPNTLWDELVDAPVIGFHRMTS